MQINDNVFVVTGGASGLGAATARMIIERGGKVVLADVNPDAGARVEAELGPNARFVATDVSNEESARRAFAAAAIFAAMSAGSASFLSLRWPHFFGKSWSSISATRATP